MKYQCLSCDSKFTEMDQTQQEYRNGQCPSCGYEDIKPVDVNYEKELADLVAMREAGRIKG